MKPKKRSPHEHGVTAPVVAPEDLARVSAALSILRQHRIHTRDILNGKDFLFSGPSREIHDALKDLLEIEHRRKRFLQFDYAQIDQYFLLRIAGSEEYQDDIAAYFD